MKRKTLLTKQQTNQEGLRPSNHEPLFSAEHDKAVAKAGGFWCHACLVAHPITEQSPDPRYCQGCYDFLLKEAKMLTGHVKKATWIPKPQKELVAKRLAEKRPQNRHQNATTNATIGGKAPERLSPIPNMVAGFCPLRITKTMQDRMRSLKVLGR